MDYEKKYNEALERAKKFEEKYGGGYAEYIFPELAESEDERIRRFLITIVNNLCAPNFKDVERKDVLAYLEKKKEPEDTSASTMAPSCWEVEQKEQKPVKVGENAYFDPNTDMWFIKKEQKPVDYDHEMWKNCEANFEGGKKEVIEHPEKYGLTKQKPAEHISKEKVFAIMKKLTSLSFCVPLGSDEEKQIDEITRDVRSLLDYPIEQKQEWSEEDEKNCNRIIRFLEPHKTFFPTKETKEEMQNWLNNRLKSLRPSWKPSEEQQSGSSALKAEGTNE